jgi:hypothetical protein
MPRDSSLHSGKPVFHRRVLRLRIKDKHAAILRDGQRGNQVWNYCNDLQQQVWRREKRFLSGYDFAPFTKGAGKEGIPALTNVQAISEEYATAQTVQKDQTALARIFRFSTFIGLDTFKASALNYRNGQLWLSGIDTPLSLWDSYGCPSISWVPATSLKMPAVAGISISRSK